MLGTSKREALGLSRSGSVAEQYRRLVVKWEKVWGGRKTALTTLKKQTSSSSRGFGFQYVRLDGGLVNGFWETARVRMIHSTRRALCYTDLIPRLLSFWRT